jgi:hypothetical protein
MAAAAGQKPSAKPNASQQSASAQKVAADQKDKEKCK